MQYNYLQKVVISNLKIEPRILFETSSHTKWEILESFAWRTTDTPLNPFSRGDLAARLRRKEGSWPHDSSVERINRGSKGISIGRSFSSVLFRTLWVGIRRSFSSVLFSSLWVGIRRSFSSVLFSRIGIRLRWTSVLLFPVGVYSS